MQPRISGTLKVFLYVLYALVLTIVLLYVRFPGAQAERFLERKLEDVFGGADVQLGIFIPRLPFELGLDRLELLDAASGMQMVMLTNVRVQPDVIGLGLKYTLSAEANGGSITAALQLEPLKGRYTLDEVQISDVQLEQSEYLQRYSRRTIRGELGFSGSVSGSWKEPDVHEGKGNLILSNGSFTLKRPVLALTEMSLEKMSVKLAVHDGEIHLTEGSFAGTEIKADYEGKIELADQGDGRAMEIRGSLVPDKEYLKEKPQVSRVVKRLQKQYRKTALPFQVTGSIESPNFRFGN